MIRNRVAQYTLNSIWYYFMLLIVAFEVFDGGVYYYTLITYNNCMSIKELREKEQLSQTAFAKRYGFSVRTLQQWEQGRCAPPDYLENMIKRIQKAKLLDLKTDTSRPFRICVERPFPNCERIYPLQQKKVRMILDAVQNDQNVEQVVIFGSSTSYTCTIDSDLDVFIKLKENSNLDLSGLTFEYDMWTNYSVDKRLMDEIDKTGVIVYG